MTIDTFSKVVETIGSKAEHYIWHGSEPLTQEMSFYRAATRLLDSYGISSSMQTSGIGLTREKAKILSSLNIKIGFSLDGPKSIHDFHRGAGTHSLVMKAIDCYRELGNSPGVIAVITKKSMNCLNEIYNFFKVNRLAFKISPMMVCGFADRDLTLSMKERSFAFISLFDRWIEENDVLTDFTSIENIVSAFFTGYNSSCEASVACQKNFIGVDTHGNFLPCSRFQAEEICYGNATTDNFEDILRNGKRIELIKRYEQLQECQVCEFSFLCHGGCPHTSLHHSMSIFAKDPFCESNLTLFKHIKKRLESEMQLHANV